ncbi:lipoxygenase 2.3, chloroplastic-like [Lolium rigidum]|uniref:lipoxygenase 2.3, chloroplastic-like n=1 Tax=Lolium rigidum TaxID=89674 RepID=UPI001F5D1793|nr:lipoxygenase 2.3, chloroplastic-like [Lolium rigidum]
MIHLKQPLVLSAQSGNVASPLFATAAAASSQQRRASKAGGGRVRTRRISCVSTEEATGVTTSVKTKERNLTVTAIVTAQAAPASMYVSRGLDDIQDLFGKTLLLELVSSELDPKTGSEREKVKAFAHMTLTPGTYEAKISVPASFGPVGAVLVENEHHREMFLKDIKLITGGDESTATTFHIDSWVHSKFDNPEPRVFFSVRSYLPSQTPPGIEALRKKELETLRGDGQGERKFHDRVYDYDTYNDLGDPDTNIQHRRPVLGSKEYPYPRRCRTGRPMTTTDPKTEKRSSTVYVPRDEQFSGIKGLTFSATTLRTGLHAILPALAPLIKKSENFPHFPSIDDLYSDGIPLPADGGAGASLHIIRDVIPRVVQMIENTTEHVLRFEVPHMVERDRFSWFRDEEFARQTLAGLNPICIRLLTEFPIVSKLDPAVYGPPESALTRELLEKMMNGVMTVDEALKSKRLFMLDYHDVFLPYVHKVRELPEKTLYGSRTVFFLGDEGTLMPLAIELTRPQSPTKPQWKRAFTSGNDATQSWLWKLAKAHVLTHDTGYHQLVSHWLRTHACVEPYIIATNRQLSRMHPVYRLLHPHFRYTMEINALARESLVNADGIIEDAFWPGKYSVELSSVAYGATWQFNTEALPEDLVSRGLAIRREDGELELTIKDYPYANDGLQIWDCIKQWATDYVNIYYKSDDDITGDQELQAWWEEVRTKGHADKKDEPWWPVCDSKDNLIQILNTIMWVTSGHHAAVNFGQYHYAGYFPNRPTVVRTNIPVEESREDEMKKFMARPEEVLLESLPSQMQAIKVMATLDILSAHSPDEEYMGEYGEPAWLAEPMVKAAFEKFSGRLKEVEGSIDEQNNNPENKNRCGAGIVPYELLKPFSEPGVTGMGIPYSISI